MSRSHPETDPMRHPIRTIALAAIATILLTGCSVSYPFQLLLKVETEDDGQPLEGVTVVLDTTSEYADKWRMDHGFHHGVPTDASGRVVLDFQITQAPDIYKHWFLKLQKDGYESTVIDIRPNPVPNSRDRTPIPITVKMKPRPPFPAT